MSPVEILTAVAEAFLRPLAVMLAALVLFAAPLFVLALVAKRRRDRFRAAALEPFTEQPLRPAGESLRLRIEKLGEEFDDILLTLLFASLLPLVVFMTAPPALRWATAAGGLLVMAVVYVRQARRLFAKQRLLWDCKLGFAGERVVGEALNQLMARGYRVFHDLPFDGFNLDHVLVGPDGVWCVETKTRRKPANVRGRDKARVHFNGRGLEYPWGEETHGVEQAQRNAATLAKWLTSATGEPTRVRSLLVLPGWYVTLRANKPVLVLNEKQIATTLPLEVDRTMTPDRFRRVVHQLTERCRLPAEDRPTIGLGGVEFATAAPRQ